MRIAAITRFSAQVAILGAIAFSAIDLARGEVKLPTIISDHMVLQSNAEIPIWGWASAGEEVVVSIGQAQATTKAGQDGRWKVTP